MNQVMLDKGIVRHNCQQSFDKYIIPPQVLLRKSVAQK